jgi:hypothetical protein
MSNKLINYSLVVYPNSVAAQAMSSKSREGAGAGSPADADLNPAQRALKSMETVHKSQLVVRQKVAVIGDAAVGKTALVSMFHSGGQTFPKNYVMTIGCDFNVKMVTLAPEHTGGLNVGVELYFFDTAGQSVFNQRQLAQKYWESVSTVMAVSGHRGWLAACCCGLCVNVVCFCFCVSSWGGAIY